MLDIDPVLTSIALLVLLTGQVYLIRPHVSGPLDPLVYFAITSAFALTLTVVYVGNFELILRIFLYFACFWIGFLFVIPGTRVEKSKLVAIHVDISFAVLIVVGVLFALLLNMYGWIIFGIPLFSSDPSLQRVESLTGGAGFVRRFNWGVGNFVLIGAVFWYLYNRSRIPLICIGALIVIYVFNGSKSAFLPLLFALGLYQLRPFGGANELRIDRKIDGWILPLLSLAIVPVVLVFFIQADDIFGALVKLITRLLYFGDTVIFWGRDELRDHFMAINHPVDYPIHLFSSLLGMLRLVPYEVPIGNQFVTYTLSAQEEIASASLGPNTPFYVKGELFFGPWLAPSYALLVGSVVAYFRRMVLDFRGGSIWQYTLSVNLAIFSMTLPTEDSLYFARITDFIIFYGVLYVVSRLIVLGSRMSGGYQ